MFLDTQIKYGKNSLFIWRKSSFLLIFSLILRGKYKTIFYNPIWQM